MEQAHSQTKKLPPPVPPPRKYVSMFRIGGVPILPPLMTTEKRRQMQKFKEKAIKLEHKLEERRRKKDKNGELVDDEELQTDSTPLTARSFKGSVSQRSWNEFDENADHQAMETAYLLLSNLMQMREDGSVLFESDPVAIQNTVESNGNDSHVTSNPSESESPTSEKNIMERMQRLQKSDTLIYDNRTNAIIMPITQAEEDQLQQSQLKASRSNLRDAVERANLNTSDTHKNFKQIPSICINPPTPLIDKRPLVCDSWSPTESVESMQITDVQRKVKGKTISNCSSDESYNCSQTSVRGARSLRTTKKLTNITTKIMHYPKDKSIAALEMKRSATSPSLKALAATRSPSRGLDVQNNNGQSSQSTLVRSNSFTLERPSKVLLDHIRQQKADTRSKNPSPKRNRRISSSCSLASRDTVESKAKRVQKVELKPRLPPSVLPHQSNHSVQRKSVASNVSKSHYSSASPCSAMTFKTKRSPYECKSATSTKRLLRKTASSSSDTVKSVKSSPLASQTKPGINVVKNMAAKPELLSAEYEAQHRQKFMQLVAQQREEQQRLQMAFEEQQKLLLAEIAAEMDKVKLCASPRRLNENEVAVELHSSPNQKSEYSELKSPTTSIGSSIMSSLLCGASTSAAATVTCEMMSTSLDTSACSTMTGGSNRRTPRRRLFPRDDVAVAITATSSSSSANRRFQQQIDNERRMDAATKINACARGFLVRRLFETEQIQRIVQTIRDTLIFVLNLHMESIENRDEANTPANIKLKARLLQQLSSASRTLHLVFFQTTIKERMEIISRDRKRIKTKLITMNLKRSPRLVR